MMLRRLFFALSILLLWAVPAAHGKSDSLSPLQDCQENSYIIDIGKIQPEKSLQGPQFVIQSEAESRTKDIPIHESSITTLAEWVGRRVVVKGLVVPKPSRRIKILEIVEGPSLPAKERICLPNRPEDWRQCQQESDCVALPGPCDTWRAVRRDRALFASDSFERSANIKECGGRFRFGDPPRVQCLENLCEPKITRPTHQEPTKAQRDWAVKTVLEIGQRSPIQSRDGLLSRALEIINFFPHQTVIEKTLHNGNERYKSTVLRFSDLHIDIYYLRGQFNGASVSPK